MPQADPSPFAHVLALAARERRRFLLAGALALALHGAVAGLGTLAASELAAFARQVQARIQARQRQELLVTLEREPPPPEPAPPEPAPTPPPKAPEPKAPPRIEKAPPKAPEPPAPAAAQAGRVLAAEPDPDEPLDLTGNTFVQGNADAYVGGVTAANGSATAPVRSARARPTGVPGGTGSAPASGVDHSRSAAPVVKNWDCPFPPEAERINYQLVNVAVTVSPSGRASDVQVLGDPGFGFGSAAQRCALGKAFAPALDRNGTALTSTIAIVVRFERR